MSFTQAQDGALHIYVVPSSEEPQQKNCYPVYQRNTMPQPKMPRHDRDHGRRMCLLPDLSKELCVLPAKGL